MCNLTNGTRGLGAEFRVGTDDSGNGASVVIHAWRDPGS
jgi:hypothetical protein